MQQLCAVWTKSITFTMFLCFSAEWMISSCLTASNIQGLLSTSQEWLYIGIGQWFQLHRSLWKAINGRQKLFHKHHFLMVRSDGLYIDQSFYDVDLAAYNYYQFIESNLNSINYLIIRYLNTPLHNIISTITMNHKILLICILPILAISINFPMFKQCDPKWANEQLGTSSNTICRAGCLMSSAAMALAGTVQKSFNPSTLNTWLKSHGGYVQQDLYVWASINPLGLVFTGFLANGDIAKKLNDGGIVILNVHNGGHWVLATGISGNTIYVNDPGYSTTSYSMSEIVAGNTGGYRIANSRLGMMIDELQSIFNINKRKSYQQQRAMLMIQQ